MTPADYRLLPYQRVVELVEEDGASYFVARVADIPWIRIDGDTPTEALLKLDEIFDDCIQSLLDRGREVPGPTAWPGAWGSIDAVAPTVEPVEAAEVLSFDLPSEAAPWSEVGEVSDELLLAIA